MDQAAELREEPDDRDPENADVAREVLQVDGDGKTRRVRLQPSVEALSEEPERLVVRLGKEALASVRGGRTEDLSRAHRPRELQPPAGVFDRHADPNLSAES